MADAGVLVPIPPVPGSVDTFAATINDNNVLTGDYETADAAMHGWVGTMDGDYESFDAPTGSTQGRGINNDGYITVYSGPSGDRFYGDTMLRKPDGKLIPVKMDGEIIDGIPEAIISHERFVGERWYVDQDYNLFIYGYYAKGRTYQADLVLPFDFQRTRPRGYNRTGEVVGYMGRTGQTYEGFVLKDGVATEVIYPDERAYYTYLEGVNKAGQIVGGWQNQEGTLGNAFFYNLDSDSFDIIDVPGSAWALALSIHRHGIITISSDLGSFIYCRKAKGCPGSANAVSVKERHVAAGLAHSVLCQHGCVNSAHSLAARKTVDAAALRAAIARDPELQRELRLPFRP